MPVYHYRSISSELLELDKQPQTKHVKKQIQLKLQAKSSVQKKLDSFLSEYQASIRDITEGIEKFENVCFSSNGNVQDYLLSVLKPRIYLVGPISKYSKYFQAKIGAEYPISEMYGLTVANFFPEMALKVLFSQDLDDKLSAVISAELASQAHSIIYSYLLNTQRVVIEGTELVGIRLVNDMAGDVVQDVEVLGKEESRVVPVQVSKDIAHLISLGPASTIQDMCKISSGTGYRPVMVNGHATGALEPIPVQDLIVCYNDDKFECASLIDSAIRIARGDTENMTDTFIKRVSSIYPVIISEDKYVNPITLEPPPVEFMSRIETGTPLISPTIVVPYQEEPLIRKKEGSRLLPEPIKPAIGYGKKIRSIALLGEELESVVGDKASKELKVSSTSRITPSTATFLYSSTLRNSCFI